MIICQGCKGNGFIRLRWEASESVEQCKVCDSQGEIKEDEYFSQSWDDDYGHPVAYHGPPLDPEGFKNYKIYPK